MSEVTKYPDDLEDVNTCQICCSNKPGSDLSECWRCKRRTCGKCGPVGRLCCAVSTEYTAEELMKSMNELSLEEGPLPGSKHWSGWWDDRDKTMQELGAAYKAAKMDGYSRVLPLDDLCRQIFPF